MASGPSSARTDEVGLLVRFVGALGDFEMVEGLALPHRNTGATITDVVLHAGLRCETVEWPKLQRVTPRVP